MEIWGGLECTFNRVGERYVDQLARSGHLHRPSDFDLIKQLGIRTLRYPIHWERVQGLSPEEYDWSFPDRQLARLQELTIEPIVGLLHHGSGPRWTNLLDPDFPARLAEYAYAVAGRYPHVRDYTPVNEPLTTARFCGLYGHWYPHHRNDKSFVQALLNQIEGTQLAMEAIRTVRPDARLIQTEDISKVYSTSHLTYQAEFENARRWISFDLLLNRFNAAHPLWNLLHESGVCARQLQRVGEAECGSLILGINYYVTSERWLDENLFQHPLDSHGGNGRDLYADVAAIKGCPSHFIGIEGIVQEVWQRYHFPLAITESHLGCTREEQLRWLMETWRAARRLELIGIDLRAVTAWALFGAFDWNSLVTAERGVYEPGCFDVRTAPPRPTQISRAVRQLARKGHFNHPVLNERGWWRRPEPASDQLISAQAGPPILILGGFGILGQSLNRVCASRALACRNLSHLEADVCEINDLRRAIELYRPWAVISTAGYTMIDDAESDRERCFRLNEVGGENVARACAEKGLPCVTFSTDLVFNGRKTEPYVESDPLSPLNIYGQSKERGERAIARAHPNALIIRTSPLFDPWSIHHLAAQIILFRDEPPLLPMGRISPTYTVDLCQAMLDLLIDEELGIWHLANVGSITWDGFSSLLRETFALPPRNHLSKAMPALRPEQSVLHSERGSMLPSLEDALTRFSRDFQPRLDAARESSPALMDALCH